MNQYAPEIPTNQWRILLPNKFVSGNLSKGFFFHSSALPVIINLDMSYEQMILTIANNGLSSRRIHSCIDNTGLSSH